MVVALTVTQIFRAGLRYGGFRWSGDYAQASNQQRRRFQANYGIPPHACLAVYHDLQTEDLGEAAIPKLTLKYFFLSLAWLKRYPTEHILAGNFSISEDTVERNIWIYCRAFQALKRKKVSSQKN